MSFIIAIDGPAGSGKGTLAKNVAQKLNLVHIDTGAMYRCVALFAIRNGIAINDKEKIEKSLESIKIELLERNGEPVVLLNSEDVTKKIREKEVTQIVSTISNIIKVRKHLVNLQRDLANNKEVIMEGRDIGTVVFPNANLKIYLDADLEVRAKRRYEEYLEKGINITYEEVKENIIKRDENDKNKEYGALKMAEDAIRIDTSALTQQQVTDKIISLIEQRKREVEQK